MRLLLKSQNVVEKQHYYEENLDSEEQICFSACTKPYSCPTLFDDYDESDSKIHEQQIISLSSEGFVQQETYQQPRENNEPVYDSYAPESLEGSEREVDELQNMLTIFSSSPTSEKSCSYINKLTSAILEPGFA